MCTPGILWVYTLGGIHFSCQSLKLGLDLVKVPSEPMSGHESQGLSLNSFPMAGEGEWP